MIVNKKNIFSFIEEEDRRQKDNITLIASENYTSKDVRKINGSILTNKYAEGYPGKRYYGGCEVIDKIENAAIENLKKLFNVKYVNVQPHSGTQANIAAYNALLNPGDKILAMSLSSGGHLSHGASFNLSGKIYDTHFYNVSKKDYLIDYSEIEKIALKIKPKLIIAGASAYPRKIDFKKFNEIAKKVNAYLLADIAHISGLIAAGLHNSPVSYADVVTSTTHKTLRGPRSGIIMTNNEDIKIKIDKSIFPGTQGGPLENTIGAKAIAFYEALSDEFKNYQKKVIYNAKLMSKIFIENGFEIITGGTDNHLFLINTKNSINKTGYEVQEKLKKINVIVNMNSLPFDSLETNVTSGIRIGTPAITTLEINEEQLVNFTKVIIKVLKNFDNIKLEIEAKKNIKKLSNKLWRNKRDNYG